MQVQKKWIAYAVVSLIACLALSEVLRSKRGSESFDFFKAIPLLGWTLEYVTVPDDYYLPLASIPICELPSNRDFSCKYSGRHLVCVRGIESRDLETSGIGLKMRVLDENGKALFYKDVHDVPIFSRGDGRGFNFHYCYFNVPQDLPKNKPLSLEVLSYGNTNVFLRCYPTSKVEIVKMADK